MLNSIYFKNRNYLKIILETFNKKLVYLINRILICIYFEFRLRIKKIDIIVKYSFFENISIMSRRFFHTFESF